MVNGIKKGKAGEVEFEKWIEKNLFEKVERNYNQAEGGCDVITSKFYFEVKRRETLALDDWWYQVRMAEELYNGRDKNNTVRFEKEKGLMPVVAFRQNRKKWEFLIPAVLIGCDRGYIRLNEKTFIEFATGG
jgi:hypothetical protein